VFRAAGKSYGAQVSGQHLEIKAAFKNACAHVQSVSVVTFC